MYILKRFSNGISASICLLMTFSCQKWVISALQIRQKLNFPVSKNSFEKSLSDLRTHGMSTNSFSSLLDAEPQHFFLFSSFTHSLNLENVPDWLIRRECAEKKPKNTLKKTSKERKLFKDLQWVARMGGEEAKMLSRKQAKKENYLKTCSE